jgi:hypothetical protein
MEMSCQFHDLVHWIGGWVGSRAGLEVMAERKIPIIDPVGILTTVVQPVA